MKIIIPTRGRIGHQQTLKNLPPTLHAMTVVVCPEDEVAQHQARYSNAKYLPQPDPAMTIAAKRAWIMREAEIRGWEKILMLDDDLFFYVRRDDKPDRLRDATGTDVCHWFDQLETRLSPELPHAGFGPRQGNHTAGTGWHVGRMMLALGYHVATVNRLVTYERVRFREDMDVSLQLLKRGYPNAVNHEFAVGQVSYASSGGCDRERTTEKSNEDAELLAALHPGLVRVVDKNYKGHPRKEVVVQWKKALQQGALRRATEAGGDETGNPG